MKDDATYSRINDTEGAKYARIWFPICEKCKHYSSDYILCTRFNIHNVNYRPKEYGYANDLKCYEAK